MKKIKVKTVEEGFKALEENVPGEVMIYDETGEVTERIWDELMKDFEWVKEYEK